jgi:hypothetical protein
LKALGGILIAKKQANLDEEGQNVSQTLSTDSLTLSSETLTEFLGGLTEEIILPRNTHLTEAQAALCLNTFAAQQKLTPNQSKTVVAILLQSGGTAKGCDGNLSTTIFGQTMKLAYLRKALSDSKCKGCERKLARFLGKEIAEIGLAINLPGNLTKKITRSHPDRTFTLQETVWLSDFQVDNKDCPEILRQFISESFGEKKQNDNSRTPRARTPRTSK